MKPVKQLAKINYQLRRTAKLFFNLMIQSYVRFQILKTETSQ